MISQKASSSGRNLHHEVGEAVDDGDALRALDRLRVGIDHPKRLHDPLHPAYLDLIGTDTKTI